MLRAIKIGYYHEAPVIVELDPVFLLRTGTPLTRRHSNHKDDSNMQVLAPTDRLD